MVNSPVTISAHCSLPKAKEQAPSNPKWMECWSSGPSCATGSTACSGAGGRDGRCAISRSGFGAIRTMAAGLRPDPGRLPRRRASTARSRAEPRFCPAGLYFDRLRDAIGCEAADEQASEALLASISIRRRRLTRKWGQSPLTPARKWGQSPQPADAEMRDSPHSSGIRRMEALVTSFRRRLPRRMGRQDPADRRDARRRARSGRSKVMAGLDPRRARQQYRRRAGRGLCRRQRSPSGR